MTGARYQSRPSFVRPGLIALSGLETALQFAVEVLVRAKGEQGERRFAGQVGEQELLIDAVELVNLYASEVAFFSAPIMELARISRMAAWTASRWLACSFL